MHNIYIIKINNIQERLISLVEKNDLIGRKKQFISSDLIAQKYFFLD